MIPTIFVYLLILYRAVLGLFLALGAVYLSVWDEREHRR